MSVFNDTTNSCTVTSRDVLNLKDVSCMYTVAANNIIANTNSCGTSYTIRKPDYDWLDDTFIIAINPQNSYYHDSNTTVSTYCSEGIGCKKSSEKEEKKNMKPTPKEIKIKIPDKDGNITIKTIIVPVPYQPRRIFFDPPATVVFWEDDTKTVVRCTEDDEFNPYYGFVCALGKKMFGTNNEIARMLKDAEWKYDKSSKNKEKKVETKPAPKSKKAQSNKNSKKEKPKK